MTWRTKLADWISGGRLTLANRISGGVFAEALFMARDGIRDAGDKMRREEAKNSVLLEERARHRDALSSIARNTCCDGCQEAARVAKEALK